MSWRWTPLLAGVLALFTGGCAVNPATGEREISLISESQEIQMGREADAGIVAQLGLYPDSAIQRYVSDLGLELAAQSERPDLPWTFRVVDDPVVNAFALPGGFIYITRGIMSHLTSEAELVGILGHEIGHVTARHSVSQMSRAQLAQIGLVAGMVFSERVRALGDVLGQSLGLLFLKYGRDDESEADRLGVRYMTRVGYQPSELSNVFRMLEQVSAQSGQRIPEWLSTHPDPGNRATAIQEGVDRSDLDMSNFLVRRAEYLERLDGIVFGPNPREGFFEDGTFYHPELRFAMNFPDGWPAQNTKQAVQAVSTEQDAIVGLTLAQGATSPSAARDEFLQSEGITQGRRWDQRVNGLPGSWAEFTAQTDQGQQLHGAVTFISYGGLVYQIMGYSPESVWNARGGAIQSTLSSFRSINDPDILNRQPERLDIVALPRAMSAEQFLQNYPSRAEPSTVSLINHFFAKTSFERGDRLKRVVE